MRRIENEGKKDMRKIIEEKQGWLERGQDGFLFSYCEALNSFRRRVVILGGRIGKGIWFLGGRVGFQCVVSFGVGKVYLMFYQFVGEGVL